MTLQHPPSPSGAERWTTIGAAIVGLLGALWAMLHYLLRPFVLWSYRRIGREVFADEWARGKASATAITALERTTESAWRELRDMRVDMDRQAEHLEKIATIESQAARTADAVDRIEVATTQIAAQVATLTEKVGEVRGAQRVHGGFSP